ncbi:uncharacterized protein YtfP isoform X2 [Medicago truncatula]|uniref:uncharacterized protein YtfP isoform X2 n=1 Tax=Medicago truncatula TaxID=3880 RepID=UPI0019675CD6|nr:uncharacterized protein YtfP isoform X2 [Medicago truncatula]
MSMAAVVCRTPQNTVTNCFSFSLGFSSRVLFNPFVFTQWKRTFTTHVLCHAKKEEKLVVVGGGAAGVYGAIHAKTIAPHLNVVIIEKGKPLSKVKISGGGRCNVTNGHCADNLILAENYPRGHKELRGSFFNVHGPVDTMSWFTSHGVELKIEDDGRAFPVSNSSSSVIDCLMTEVQRRGVSMQTKKNVTAVSVLSCGKFLLEIKQLPAGSSEQVEVDYLLIATGSSRQVSFPKVKVRLKLDSLQKNIPQLTQVGPLLITHWGLSGPAILRLSAWGARYLFSSGYKGRLIVDFIPDVHIESLKTIISRHKLQFAKQKVVNSCPLEFGITKRFWSYLLERQGLSGDILWASISNNALISIGSLLKDCTFEIKGKGPFKDEFVTAGGVPLSEVSLNTMKSKICSNLFFAGEILNVDGVTGGFNFQNAWSGGFIAGTTIGGLALGSCV